MNPTPRDGELAQHRLIVISLAVAALVVAWLYMAAIGRNDPWYRNTDMNIHNTVDALAINSGIPPHHFDQPGLPSKYLLALDFRIRHFSGTLPVWNLKKLDYSADPLRELPALIRIGRVHSRIQVMLFILSAAALVYAVTRTLDSACLAVILLCGSTGLLFNGLLTRTELLCAWLGTVAALYCVWQATLRSPGLKHHLWLVLGGLCIGVSILVKLPGMFYLITCYAWCWLAAWTPVPRPSAPGFGAKPGFWIDALPTLCCALILGLLFHLTGTQASLGPVALFRIRAAAGAIALLPLLGLALATELRPRGLFLLERGRELALLGGGALLAPVFGYLACCLVMPEASASDYLSRILDFVFNPGPTMNVILAKKPEVMREFWIFFRETPVLLISGVVALVVACRLRSLPLRLRALMGLLAVTGLGFTLMMSRRYFFYPYLVYVQVPLLLVWALALFGKARVLPDSSQPGGVLWTTPLIFVTAFVIMLSVYIRAQPKYENFQSDRGPPVSELTLTLLFDHDVLPPRYREIMARHYGDRQQFGKKLERFLADPANRY